MSDAALVKLLSRHYIEHHDTAIAQDIVEVDDRLSTQPTQPVLSQLKRSPPTMTEVARGRKAPRLAGQDRVCRYDIINVSTASQLSCKGNWILKYPNYSPFFEKT